MLTDTNVIFIKKTDFWGFDSFGFFAYRQKELSFCLFHFLGGFAMDELIRINYDSERPTVNGRDLHEALQVKTAYKDWFPRMCEYGFVEGRDFCSF